MAMDQLNQAMLMAQLQKKQELKQRMRDTQAQENEIFDMFMRNAVFFAIESRSDIFSFFRTLSYNGQENPMSLSMLWLDRIAALTERSHYEFLLNDEDKQEVILRHLLRDISSCDAWSDFEVTEQGASFALHGFDYAIRMSDQPSVSLIFDMEQTQFGEEYSLVLVDGLMEGYMLPKQIVLWQESDGMLARFMKQVLEAYMEERAETEELVQIGGQIMELEQIFEQADAFTASMKGVSDKVIWKQMAQDLQQLQNQVKEYLHNHPKYETLREAILLLAGAERMMLELSVEEEGFMQQAEEIAFLLNGAVESMNSSIRQ